MRFFDEEEVARLLPYEECIPLMKDVLSRFSQGQCVQPLRTIVRRPSSGMLLGSMPCYLGGEQSGFGIKVMALNPANPSRGLDLHIGVVIIFDADTCKPSAILDAGGITRIRTAAATAAATDALASRDSRHLSILGAGVQARSHAKAICQIRAIEHIDLWNRTRTHAERFAAELAQWFRGSITIQQTVQEAVQHADIVCATTASTVPLIEADMPKAGAHINLIGSSFPDAREGAAELIARARVFVDARESAINESGDIREAIHRKLIDAERDLCEIGLVFAGQAEGRSRADEVTLFKSLGLAVEDVASAMWIYRNDEVSNITTLDQAQVQ